MECRNNIDEKRKHLLIITKYFTDLTFTSGRYVLNINSLCHRKETPKRSICEVSAGELIGGQKINYLWTY